MIRKTVISSINFYVTFLLVTTQFRRSYGNNSTSSDNGTIEQIMSGIELLHEGKFAEAAEKFQLSYISSQKLSCDKLSQSSKAASSAFRHLKTGKFAEAATIFQEASDANYVEGDFLTASTALAVAVFDSCRDASLLAIRGHLLLKQGHFNASADTFQQARAKSNITEAVSTFDNCIKAITIASTGKSLFMDGYFEGAADIFQRAYETSKVDAVSFTLFNFKTQCNLARTGLHSLQRGYFENASKSFQAAYEMSNVPSFYDTFAMFRDASNEAKLGRTFFRHGMFSNALSRFENAFNKTRIRTLNSYINATTSAITGYELLAGNRTLEAASRFEHALLLRHNLLLDDVEVLVNCRDTLNTAAEGMDLMNSLKFHEALSQFQEAFSLSTVREVKHVLSSYVKLPYEGESYCRHDDLETMGMKLHLYA